MAKIVKLLNIVGSDYPSSVYSKWNKKKKNFSISSESGKKIPKQI